MAELKLPPLGSTNSTRLVVLHPGNHNGPLAAGLIEVDMPSPTCQTAQQPSQKRTCPEDDTFHIEVQHPHFQALRDRRFIVIDGTNVAIRKNLFDALQRVRLADQDRILWIDAVSINQNDLGEKSRQVAIIGEIFKKATRVLAWVGESADASELIFKYGSKPPSPNEGNPETKALSSAWGKFLMRQYWQRTWIMQEIAVARELLILCGASTGKWETLFEGWGTGPTYACPFSYSAMDEDIRREDRLKLVDREECVLGVLEIRWVYTWSPSDLDFSTCLGKTKLTKCFDRKDKIYAIISLMQSPGIGVDYNLGVPDLMVQTIRALLNDSSRHPTSIVQDVLSALEVKSEEVLQAVDLLIDGHDDFDEPLARAVDNLLAMEFELEVQYKSFGRVKNHDWRAYKDYALAWRAQAQEKGMYPSEDSPFDTLTAGPGLFLQALATATRGGGLNSSRFAPSQLGKMDSSRQNSKEEPDLNSVEL